MVMCNNLFTISFFLIFTREGLLPTRLIALITITKMHFLAVLALVRSLDLALEFIELWLKMAAFLFNASGKTDPEVTDCILDSVDGEVLACIDDACFESFDVARAGFKECPLHLGPE